MKRTLPIAVVVLLLMAAPASAQGPADREGVRRAVLDYVEGFYEGDTLKLARSIRPDVVKYGYYKKSGESGYTGEAMPWSEFLSYALRVKARNRPVPTTAPKEIAVLDVADQTAAAKLTASWGIDYLHLAKFEGRWMITQVLWQAPPPK